MVLPNSNVHEQSTSVPTSANSVPFIVLPSFGTALPRNYTALSLSESENFFIYSMLLSRYGKVSFIYWITLSAWQRSVLAFRIVFS